MDMQIHVPDDMLRTITLMLKTLNHGLTIDDVRKRFADSTSANIEKLYRRREVADRLKVSLSTIDRWLADGTLGKVNIGGCVRIPESEIQKLIMGS